jgi:hypothetical protein
LKNDGCCSPHRPGNPIQGNSRTASDCALGIVRTSGRTSKVGPRVSSQPTPSEADAAEVEGLVVEVRVRAVRRMHDRVRAVRELELVIAPVGPLRPLVLAVADLGRLGLQRLAGR